MKFARKRLRIFEHAFIRLYDCLGALKDYESQSYMLITQKPHTKCKRETEENNAQKIRLPSSLVCFRG